MRPNRWGSFIGQTRVVKNLQTWIRAAKGRGKQLSHVLLTGPPGLGKTTLARLVAADLRGDLSIFGGPSLSPTRVLDSLTPGCVVFVDEIHAAKSKDLESLYPAMEDYRREDGWPLPEFTLIGATTDPGALPKPLRDRFGIWERLEFYSQSEMEQIVIRYARSMGMRGIENHALSLLASRGRGTPRVLRQIMDRVRDIVGEGGMIRHGHVTQCMCLLGIDEDGLTVQERSILESLIGGVRGVESIASAINEPRASVETIHEPYLIRSGLIERRPGGRAITRAGLEIVRPRPRFREVV